MVAYNLYLQYVANSETNLLSSIDNWLQLQQKHATTTITNNNNRVVYAANYEAVLFLEWVIHFLASLRKGLGV